MSVFFILGLFFLSLFGYALGPAILSGKGAVRKPEIPDVCIVAGIWIAIIVREGRLFSSRWMSFGAGILAGLVLGLIMTWIMGAARLEGGRANTAEGNRKAWKEFLAKVGTFQSQIFLSFIYFLLVLPFALAVKFFSDPLGIKKPSDTTHWLPKKKTAPDLELFKRQY
jgi:hypothetical protein